MSFELISGIESKRKPRERLASLQFFVRVNSIPSNKKERIGSETDLGGKNAQQKAVTNGAATFNQAAGMS